MKADESKKEWVMPQLTIYGDVEKITQGEKTYGGTDGFTFKSTVVQSAS
jgi:hypothetical protein